MPGNSNDFSYEWDNRSLLQAVKEANKSLQDFAKTGNTTGDQLSKVFEKVGHLSEVAVVSIDKQEKANRRLVASVIAQNDAYGKTAVDKTIQQRDRVIKQLGDNDKAIKQVTASYDALIKKMKEAEGGGGHGSGPLSGAGRFAFLGAKDLLEGRTTNAVAEASNVLTRLGGTALVVGGVAAALVAVGGAAIKARSYLAEYGTTIRDIELQTGLTAKQTATFSFAAQAVGKDVTVVERLMRGLSQATEELGPSGDKARKTLADLGVSVLDINGAVRPTADLLLSISDGMAKLAPGTKLSADAMALFKRAGIDAIPFLKELRENTDFAVAHGLPAPTEEDITRWSNYTKQIALFDSYWNEIKRTAADKLAIKLEFVTSVVGGGVALFEKFFGKGGVRSDGIDVVAGPRGGGEGPLRYLTRAQADEEAKQDQATAELNRHGGLMAATVASKRVAPFLASLGSSTHERAERDLSVMKQELDKQVTALERLGQAGLVYADVELKQEQAVTKANDDYQKQLALVKSLSAADSERISNAEALRRLVETTTQNMAEGPYISKTDRTLLEFSRRAGVTPSQISAAELSLRPEAQREGELGVSRAQARGREDIEKTLKSISAESHTYDDRAFTASLQQQAVLIKENLAIYSAGLKEINKSELEAAESGVRLASILAPDTLANRRATESQIAAIKIASINEISRQEREDAQVKFVDGVDKATAIRNIEIKNAREVAGVRSELAEQNAKEYRQQLDSIKKETQSLLETLFTNPSKFGSQLGSTLRTAVLRPITDGLSERISTGLHPLIFGRNGTTGIAGGLRSLVGGGTNIGAPLMPAASALTYAAGALTSAASTLSMGGGGSGFTLPSVGGSGGVGGGISSLPFGGSAMAALGGLGLGPGGTSGFSGPVGGGGSGGFNLGGLLGGSVRNGSGGGGFNLSSLRGLGSTLGRSGSTILSNLHETARSLRSALGFGGPHQGGSVLGNLSRGLASDTPFAGAVAAGGIALASHGLLGEARGTRSGVAQGAAGGFLVAGPIGAAVGAAIGIGEMLAGVESPRREAKRLVKGLYSITINNNTADQIVGIAKERYFNHVSIAVRSPEVRQMLGLYAAGTGQAGMFPQSAGLPHGGGLAMSGGSLFQTPSYQYGNPYAYSSSLPVLGGQSYGLPSPSGGGGGPVMLSVNVEGSGIAPFFSGQVVNADYVQSRQSQAWQASNGRISSSLALAQPGSIAG